MASGDPVVNETLTVGVAWEQTRTRKYSSICECIVNFLYIMVSDDPDVKEAMTVGVAREQAWTTKSFAICEFSGYF